MIRSRLLGLSALAVTACMPQARPEPAPRNVTTRTLTTSHRPQDVVQIASRELIAAGFDIATIDPQAGVVTARLTRSPDAHGPLVQCTARPGSIVAESGRTTLIVSVRARPASTGSEVLLSTRAATNYSGAAGMSGGRPDSETDCVSSGEIEDRILRALAP
jgi:hypothetical protein